MKRILVAVDFSDVTDRVLQVAADLVRATGGALCILHSEPPEPAFVGFEPGPQEVRDILAEQMREDHKKLHEISTRLAAEGLEVQTRQFQGPTVDKILLEAAHFQADLIAIGAHQHGLLHHLLFGSIRETLIARSEIPVLVVPVAYFTAGHAPAKI